MEGGEVMGELIRTVYCTFCGKSQHNVKLIITGHDGSAICDECVVLCNEIIKEKETPNAHDKP